jgi:Tfp pilus assembly protein PilF
MDAAAATCQEGIKVRTEWFAAWALVAVAAGCGGGTSGAGVGVGMGVGMASQPPAPAGSQFTDWMKAPFVKAGVIKPNRVAGAPGQALPPQSAAQNATTPTPQLYTAMAEVSQRAGNVDQARSQYQKALSLDPNDLNALLGAAHMEDRLGRLDVALPLYERAVNVSPGNASAINDLALCLARRGDLTAAHRTLERAVQLEPQNALYRNNIAKVMVEMNWTDQALGQLSAVHPPAVSHYNTGVLLSQRGRQADAIRYLHAAAAIDPSLRPAQQLLEQLGAPTESSAADQPVLQTAQLAPGAVPSVDHSIRPTPSVMMPGYMSKGQWPGNTAVSAGEPFQPVLLPPVE